MGELKQREGAAWVMITGSSSGLGEQLAIEYAEKGFDIILHGRDAYRLKKVHERILGAGVRCEAVLGNLEEHELLIELVNLAREKNTKILINNAALLCRGESLVDLDQRYIDSAIAVNLQAPIFLIKNLISQLMYIVNINSVAAYERKQNRTIYCASKGALKIFSETLSLETDTKLLDVYISKLKKSPLDFGLDLNIVASEVYNSFHTNDHSLVLDGRGGETVVIRNKTEHKIL